MPDPVVKPADGGSATSAQGGDGGKPASGTLVGDTASAAKPEDTGGNAAGTQTDAEKVAAAAAAEAAKEKKPDEKLAETEEQKKAREAREAELAGLRGAPEKYELQAPEGIELDATLMSAAEPILRKLDLSGAGAQEVVDLYAKTVLPEINNRAVQAWIKRQEGWVEEIKADKEIGGTALEGNKVFMARGIRHFCTDDKGKVNEAEVESLQKALIDTGFGNTLAAARFFTRVGKSVSEDTVERGNLGSQVKGDMADRLYGKSQT